jgi:hypothetical protein
LLGSDIRRELLKMATQAGVNDDDDNDHRHQGGRRNNNDGDDEYLHGAAISQSSTYPCLVGCLTCRRVNGRQSRFFPLCLCYGVLGQIHVTHSLDTWCQVSSKSMARGHVIISTALARRAHRQVRSEGMGINNDQLLQEEERITGFMQLRALWARELAHVKWSHAHRLQWIRWLTWVILYIVAVYGWEWFCYRSARRLDIVNNWDTNRLAWQEMIWRATFMSLRWMPTLAGQLCFICIITYSWIRRRYESKADRFSVELNGPHALVNNHIKLQY